VEDKRAEHLASRKLAHRADFDGWAICRVEDLESLDPARVGGERTEGVRHAILCGVLVVLVCKGLYGIVVQDRVQVR